MEDCYNSKLSPTRYLISVPETSSDESVKEVIVPLGAGATLSCEASSALMPSSTSPSVMYSWSKYQGKMAKDVVMQGVSERE